MQFKILNEIYPSNKFLHSKFNFENEPCYLCKYLAEDTEHIFFTCSLSQSFWKALRDWMVEKGVVADGFTLTLQDVMYGITKECSVLYDLINIVLLAKYFIHKCRYFKSSPLFIVFQTDLKYFSDALSKMKNPKAVKLFNLFVSYNLL